MRGSQVKVMSEPLALCIPFSLEVSAFQRQRVDPITLKLYIPYCHLPMDKSGADGFNWNVTSRHIRVVSFAYYLVRVVSFTYSLVGVVSFAYSLVGVINFAYSLVRVVTSPTPSSGSSVSPIPFNLVVSAFHL